MKICVYAICKNESRFVDDWVKSMSEADEIVVLDTGSTDDTVARLRAKGVRVFEEKIEPWRFDVARNRSLARVPEDADVCVCTDLDEVFHPGWRAKLEAAWRPGTTRASYRYTWNFNPDGSEGYVFWIEKAHARQGYRWRNPVHEVLEWTGAPGGERKVSVDGIQIDHHADETKSRGQYLPLLELSVRENPDDDRGWHYLGREYMFYGQPDRAIETLKHHLSLPSATWVDERCASMRYIARCFLRMGRPEAAEAWYWRAMAEAPHLREPFIELAQLCCIREDWEGAVWLTGRALEITERPRTYISEAESWGSLPWDLRAMGLYYTGRIAESLAAAERALALSPSDERLRENIHLIRNTLESSKNT